MTVTTAITPEQLNAVAEALHDPTWHPGSGLGSGETKCTIAQINFALTGTLTDELHPCMSPVIRRWVIRVQDAMPASIRQSQAWRDAATGIAGSAASADVERRRVDLLLDWMWEALADEAVIAALPDSVRVAWSEMLEQRTAADADAAAAYADAAPAAQVIDSVPGTIRLRGEAYARSQRDAFLRRNGDMVYRTKGGNLRPVAAPDRATFVLDDISLAVEHAAALAEDAERDLDAHTPRLIDAAADLSPAHAELGQLLHDTAPDAQRAADDNTRAVNAVRAAGRGSEAARWDDTRGYSSTTPSALAHRTDLHGPGMSNYDAAMAGLAASSPSSAEDDTDGHAAIVRPASSRFIGNDARNGAEAECWECGDRIINHPSDGTYRHAAGVVERAHGEAIAEDQARDRARS